MRTHTYVIILIKKYYEKSRLKIYNTFEKIITVRLRIQAHQNASIILIVPVYFNIHKKKERKKKKLSFLNTILSDRLRNYH